MSPQLRPDSFLPEEDLANRILLYSLPELESLQGWLKEVIRQRKQTATQPEIPLKKGREVIEIRDEDTVTFRLEKVKCGKKKCKCTKGKLHGPYWYAYQWNGKKLKSTYVGKTLQLEPAVEESGPGNGHHVPQEDG